MVAAPGFAVAYVVPTPWIDVVVDVVQLMQLGIASTLIVFAEELYIFNFTVAALAAATPQPMRDAVRNSAFKNFCINNLSQMPPVARRAEICAQKLHYTTQRRKLSHRQSDQQFVIVIDGHVLAKPQVEFNEILRSAR
ncbi:hypothetical protein J2X76_003958 [Neorhizobium sp. 2083]|uniref:hypothetical protein n=1 Tax=Neorhizobium sp. 2083 TaxID=2817762 RepID=UPI00285F2E1B|nr:hypothetical protein [Neorhizobium sp. 2083]MDR6818776.1 hypothetical protein [Neorhizobium sp. 2083]